MFVRIYIPTRHCITACFHKPSPTLCAIRLNLFCQSEENEMLSWFRYSFYWLWWGQALILCLLVIWAFCSMSCLFISLAHFLFFFFYYWFSFIHIIIHLFNSTYCPSTVSRHSFRCRRNINGQKKTPALTLWNLHFWREVDRIYEKIVNIQCAARWYVKWEN